jgi:hypothetical protein
LIVGIDLGTTRSAIACGVDLGIGSEIDVKIEDFSPDALEHPLPNPPTSLYYQEGIRLPFTGAYVKQILKSTSSRRDFDSERLFHLVSTTKLLGFLAACSLNSLHLPFPTKTTVPPPFYLFLL